MSALLRVWAALASIRNRPRMKLFVHGMTQLVFALDQLANVLSNPFSYETWADETLSARCGRINHRNPYKFWERVIDKMFFWQPPKHCVRAHQNEMARYNSPPSTRLPQVGK